MGYGFGPLMVVEWDEKEHSDIIQGALALIRRCLTAAVVALMLGSLLPSMAAATPPARDSQARHAPNRALVGVAPDGRSQAQAAIHARGGRVVSYYEPGDFFIVETPSAAPDWVAGMRGEPSVRYAELDYEITVDTHAPPNDPRYGELWGLSKIGMPAAWDTSTGSPSVVVGVIDTGVDYLHPDLRQNMWLNPGESGGGRETNGVDDDGNGRVDDVYGNDCRNNDGNPMDDHGHGTHVAGTIGAVGNNSIGVVGVNWNVKIMALKFLSASGSGSTTDAVECLDYAIAKGATLTNNSWGGGGFSQALYDAIGRARGANQLFIAAAGNSGVNTDSSPHYPSSYDQANIVSVAATDQNDALASFSNYGSKSVDLGAPGVSILSTTRNDTYGSKSGTSMAAPHVAGAAAILCAQSSGYKTNYSALKDSLVLSGDLVGSLSGKTVSGRRLNVAVALARPAPAPDLPPAVSFTSPTPGPVSGTVPLSASASDDVAVSQVEFFQGTSSIGLGTPADSSWTINWDSSTVPDGFYTLKAVATDTVGQTATASVEVTVDNPDPPASTISLSAVGYKMKGLQKVDLSWSGTSSNVDIYRADRSVPLQTNLAGSSYTDNINLKGSGRYVYKVCSTGSLTNCSNEVTVVF